MNKNKLIELIDSNGRFNLPTTELEHLADHLIANGIGDINAENEELKDRCNYIWAIGCDYDGANPNDAIQMRQLVDELVGIAVDGLEQTVFCNDEKTEIQPRKVKLCNLKMENEELLEYGNQKYEDTINEFLDCLINAAAIPSCAADKFHCWHDREIAETEKRVAKEFAEKFLEYIKRVNYFAIVNWGKKDYKMNVSDISEVLNAVSKEYGIDLAEQFGKEE